MCKIAFKFFLGILLINLLLTTFAQNLSLMIKTGHSNKITSLVFSLDGKLLASGSDDETIRIWNVKTQMELLSLSAYSKVSELTFFQDIVCDASNCWSVLNGKEVERPSDSAPKNFSKVENDSFYLVSPNNSLIASSNKCSTIYIFNSANRELKHKIENIRCFYNAAFSPDSNFLATGDSNGEVKIWNLLNGAEIFHSVTQTDSITAIAISQDDSLLVSGSGVEQGSSEYDSIDIWDLKTGRLFGSLRDKFISVKYLKISSDNKILAAVTENSFKIWDIETGRKSFSKPENAFLQTSSNFFYFCKGNKSIIYGQSSIDIETGKERKIVTFNNMELADLFEEKELALFVTSYESRTDGTIPEQRKVNDTIIFSYENRKILQKISFKGIFDESDNEEILFNFTKDGNFVVGKSRTKNVVWNIKTGKTVTDSEDFKLYFSNQTFDKYYLQETKDNMNLLAIVSSPQNEVIKLIDAQTMKTRFTLNGHQNRVTSLKFNSNGKILVSGSLDSTIKFWNVKKGLLIAQLIPFDNGHWIVTTSKGQFDIDCSLEGIKGLHWIVKDEFLKPLPLEIFLRQYYEPNLLPRLLKCTEENNCPKEFKPLPSIAEINRVQPNVKIKEIKPVSNSNDLADVTIEVENVTEEVSLSATDKTQKKQLSSGLYDLRLFRDGQLVGVSTPKNKLAQFIADAPRLVAENKALGKLIDTPEDKAWREVNDIFKIKAENVKQVSPTKIEYTFRNVKLPSDGRKEVEFTAYAFNSDKVKSTTTEPFKFTIPTTVANAPKKGHAVVVSIGVNASENPAYALRYAANDARKIQEVIGERLKKNLDKYSEVVQIPLISDYGTNGNLSENTAQKAIIKGVFSLLSGNGKEVPENILKQIPNYEKIKPIEPEDTLLIAFSGHGYADQAGIFYLLPYDIGKETTKLTAEALQKTISSDELSLWMQDITAAEMIMIIDACHSSAAVQGDGFKPGPMGSRGLGQLAYDKDMKILSATQADNVALELGSLQQGLLSYALIQDGIVEGKADADKNKQLSSNEWLSYAEKRVPKLYQEVKDGKRGIIIDGNLINSRNSDVINLSLNQKNTNLQQPNLFDFKRRKTQNFIFKLP